MTAFQTRRYYRRYDWVYPPTEPPVPPTSGNLIPVFWGGLPLNLGEDPETGLCAVVENIEGWLDSPPLNGNDAARAVADGSAWGPKTLGARVVTVTGAATGPRELLAGLRDQLAALAASRDPAPLTVTNAGGAGRSMTADVRAGTDAFRHTWIGHTGFRWSVVLTAADPLLYEDSWQTAQLSNGSPGGTGRAYQRSYPWQYASPNLPNSVQLTNAGNWPAPVFALYTGDLSPSRLTDEQSGLILVDSLDAGMTISVDTSTLVAVADGGLSRASYILPGSLPMTIPPGTTVQWHLYSTGAGTVQLAWRSAWV